MASDSLSARPQNVVYIVLDDMGFASTGAFGNDVIHTPNIDRLADEGLRYNNFHTTAICSATRASLLTGANHHKAGVASLVDWTAGSSNAVGHVKDSYGTTAEILRENGYATFAVGKWHLTQHQTPAGPFDQWPLGRGFDRYYGVLPGMGDQYHPQLVQDNGYIKQPKEPSEGYHLSEDLVDHAIDYVFTQKTAFPNQPFFLYLAFGALHTPFQAPAEYIEKYRGAFHEGWDVLRQRWFENQKRLGVIPQDADLTERNEFAPAWDELTDGERELAERYVEAFAGFLEHTDAQIGRLVEYLRSEGLLDDTLVVLLSDNGASGEGGRNGTPNILRVGSGTTSREIDDDADAYALSHEDEIGGEFSFVHYPSGWANAFNTPFPWYKILTFEGGTKDDLIVRWPAAIHDPGAVRGQYLHVSDVTPTVVDALGLEKPATVRGVAQEPFTGVSFASTFGRASAPEVRTEQYYEMLGNSAIYKDGWKAVVNHLVHSPDFSKDEWELYHVADDYSEAHDVARRYPEKLRELKAEFLLEAGRNDVFPLIGGILDSEEGGSEGDGKGPDCEAVSAAVPHLPRATFRDIIRPFFVPRTLPEELSGREVVDVDKAAHRVSARLVLKPGDEGVIISHGSRFGGFSLFVQEGRLHYVYNANRVSYHELVSRDALPGGEVEVGYRFVPAESKGRFAPGNNGADVELFVDGALAAEPLHISRLVGFNLGMVELGANHFTEVAPSYSFPFAFTGKILEVTLEQLEAPARFRNIQLADAWKAD